MIAMLKKTRNACARGIFRLLGPRRSNRLLEYLMFQATGDNPLEFAHRRMGIGWADYAHSGEAWFIENVLPTWIRKVGPVLFDVGANVGNYSESLRKLFSDATIHAFEPNPECWGALDKRAGASGIIVHHFGFSDAVAHAKIWRHDDDNAHSSLYPQVIEEQHGKPKSALDIELRTLDGFLEQGGLTEVDFLKIDTEGHEIHVLRGAAKAISMKRIAIIQFEFNKMNIISRTFLRDFFLELRDFAMFRITPNGLYPLRGHRNSDEIFEFQNIVAIRKDMAHLVDECTP